MDVTLEFVNQTNQLMVDNIKRRMNDLDWKIPQLAKATGLSASGLYGVIDGERWPNPDNMERIAKALGMTPAELLSDMSKGKAPPETTPEQALKIIENALKARKTILSAVPAPALDLSSLEKGEVASVMNMLRSFKSINARKLLDSMESKKDKA